MMRRSITSMPRRLASHRAPRDPVAKAIGDRRMDRALRGKKDIGAGAFRDPPLFVKFSSCVPPDLDSAGPA
jgi:hypothetical protein